jgi:tRNA 2-thiouridine synthesizing protein A
MTDKAATQDITPEGQASEHAWSRELDARGLNCPLPVLKARKLLKAMRPGERLRVLATDPRAPGDMEELCAASGWGLIEVGEDAGTFAFLLERR